MTETIRNLRSIAAKYGIPFSTIWGMMGKEKWMWYGKASKNMHKVHVTLPKNFPDADGVVSDLFSFFTNNGFVFNHEENTNLSQVVSGDLVSRNYYFSEE